MLQLTFDHAQQQLAKWLQASLDVAEGKTVSISSSSGMRSLSYENGDEIRKQIIFWQNQVQRLSDNKPEPRHSVVRF